MAWCFQLNCRNEAGSYLRLIDFVFYPTLGLRALKKKNKTHAGGISRALTKLKKKNLGVRGTEG